MNKIYNYFDKGIPVLITHPDFCGITIIEMVYQYEDGSLEIVIESDMVLEVKNIISIIPFPC